MKLTKEQYKQIAEVVLNNPELSKIWTKKLLYIYDDYLKKVSHMLDVISINDAQLLLKRLGGSKLIEGTNSEAVGTVISGLSLMDSFNAMAADVLTEGEMRLISDDTRRSS